MPTVRYLVSDVQNAVAFYIGHLGFELIEEYGPAMAIVKGYGLNLWLAGPTSSAAKTLPLKGSPSPGGWNRIVLEVDDLEKFGARLRLEKVSILSPIRVGPGGSQMLCADPSGNLIELFQSR